MLLDCAEALNVHRFGLDDERVTQSLVGVGFIPGRETFVSQFKENVIKNTDYAGLRASVGDDGVAHRVPA